MRYSRDCYNQGKFTQSFLDQRALWTTKCSNTVIKRKLLIVKLRLASSVPDDTFRDFPQQDVSVHLAHSKRSFGDRHLYSA